ncbi:Trp-like family, partial [Globisporangium splendens]
MVHLTKHIAWLAVGVAAVVAVAPSTAAAAPLANTDNSSSNALQATGSSSSGTTTGLILHQEDAGFPHIEASGATTIVPTVTAGSSTSDALDSKKELRSMDDPSDASVTPTSSAGDDAPKTSSGADQVRSMDDPQVAVSGSLSVDTSAINPTTNVPSPTPNHPATLPPSSPAPVAITPTAGSSDGVVITTPTPTSSSPVPTPTTADPVPIIPGNRTDSPTPEPSPTPMRTPTPSSSESTPEPSPSPNEPSSSPAPSSTKTDPPIKWDNAPTIPIPTTQVDPMPTGPAPTTQTPTPTTTPKPNLIFDITRDDDVTKKYTRGDKADTPIVQEDRSGSMETQVTTTKEENIIGGNTRANPVNAVSMSKSFVAFHDVLRFTTCTFAGISVALLLFLHYVSFDPNVNWSAAVLWSPNTWEFVLYIGYLQQMGSLSQLNLVRTPYFLWDFTDAFSWSLFLIQRSNGDSTVTSRRLDSVVLTGVVAYGDRIGIKETNLLFLCTLAFLLVFGVLFAVYVTLVLFAKRKAEDSDKFDAIDSYSVIDPSQASNVYGLRLISLRFLGLCVLIWLFALYPMSLFASFEIAMEIDANKFSAGSLVLAIIVLGVVCFGVLAVAIRELYHKSERELLDVKNQALWGSLYAAYTYRRRLFFVVVVAVQLSSGFLIGIMNIVSSATSMLALVLIVQVVYLGAVFFQAGFVALSVGLFTFTLSVVKIANFALAFAFLDVTNQSSDVRSRAANAFIFLNSIVLIAWFVRHVIMFALALRLLSKRNTNKQNGGAGARNFHPRPTRFDRERDDYDDDELEPELVEFQTPVERIDVAGHAHSGDLTSTSSSCDLTASQVSSGRGSNVYVTMVVSPPAARADREPSYHSAAGSSFSPRATIKVAL